jgi:tRNA(His) 5'-end guanylyltransferase
LERGAFFDARVFNVPFEDVVNNFIWRQQDAIRNAISAIGQATYTHKELQGKSTKDIIWMLENDGNSIMNYPLKYLRGSACYKGVEERYSEYAGDFITRNVWKIDEEIPIFSEVRNFIPLR